MASALIGITAVLAAQFAWVKPTNFGGFDEWGIISSVARGIVDAPHANRPLQLLWSLPARLGPPSLWTYYALHLGYLAGIGGLVFWLGRRWLPHEPLTAFLAGVFAVTWAPLDYHRLNVTLTYAGLTFSAFLAVALLVESWQSRRPVLLMLGALVAFVNLRGFEAGAAVLAAAPALLSWARRPPRAWAWIAVWEAAVLLALTLVALPLLLPGRGLVYQQQILGGMDLQPSRVLKRLAEQYGHHLLPLLTTPPSELAVAAVPATLAAFAAALLLAARRLPTRMDRETRRECVLLMARGLLLAGLGYFVFVLTAGQIQAARTQFFSAPGIGLFLAASFTLLSSFAHGRRRLVLLCVLAGWVVAVGTGRTMALQRFWDQVSLHADQVRLLRQLVEMAPHLRPNTYIILIDEADVFAATFTFRNALTYVYPGEAIGYVWRKWDVFFPMRFTQEGVLSEPWPELREAWHAPVTHHRYDEVIVLRQTPAGALVLLDEWPADKLPPLPPGASYSPRLRILPGPPPRERGILGGRS